MRFAIIARHVTHDSRRRAVVGFPPSQRRIDVVDALDLLDHCVRERGQGYRTTTRPRTPGLRTDRDPSLRSAVRRDGIVNHALLRSVVLGAVDYVADPGTGTDVGAAGWDASVLTLGASVVFRAAESTDRRGGTWGEAQADALQAVARFVAVIPDSLGLGAHLAIRVADADQPHVLGVWLSSPVLS